MEYIIRLNICLFHAFSILFLSKHGCHVWLSIGQSASSAVPAGTQLFSHDCGLRDPTLKATRLAEGPKELRSSKARGH